MVIVALFVAAFFFSPKVQVIPWVLSDTNYVRGPHQRLDTSWTVFVGGLHGMLNAGNG